VAGGEGALGDSALSSRTAVRPCPVCGGRQCEWIRREQFVLVEGHPLAEGYDVVACAACGMVYADTSVTREQYDLFYERMSKYADTTSTGGGEWPEDRARLREMAADLARLVPDRDAFVVDVGCASGGLLQELRSLGFRRLLGVDPAQACVDNTRRAALPAERGSLVALPGGASAVDLFVLSHVLEHVHDVGEALAEVRSRLSPRGGVYVEVPDATRYARFLAAPFQDFNTEHINHFSAACLATLLDQHGLRVVESHPRDLHAATGVPYPAIWAFAVRGEGAPPAITRDHGLVSAVREYVAASSALLERVDRRLRAIDRETPIVVWGVGETTRKLLAVSALRDLRIAAFVDSNPLYHGRTLRGAPILAPAALAGLAHPILIGSLVNARGILDAIARLGLPNRVLTLVEA